MKTNAVLTGSILVLMLWGGSVWFAYERGHENGGRDQRLCWNVTVEQPIEEEQTPPNFVPSTARPRLVAYLRSRHPSQPRIVSRKSINKNVITSFSISGDVSH